MAHLASKLAVSTRFVALAPPSCKPTDIESVQLVDTKSVNNTTLLHFLERTIHKEFPDMEVFLDELAKPAEVYRGEGSNISGGGAVH